MVYQDWEGKFTSTLVRHANGLLTNQSELDQTTSKRRPKKPTIPKQTDLFSASHAAPEERDWNLHAGGQGFESSRKVLRLRVQPGDIGDTSYLRHG